MAFKKCNKCDDRGHITDTPFPAYSGHSCDCEWGVERVQRIPFIGCETCLDEKEITYNAGMDDEYTVKCPDCCFAEETDMTGASDSGDR